MSHQQQQQQQQVPKTTPGDVVVANSGGSTTTANANNNNNLLGHFLSSDEFLCGNLLSFLSTNDVTILSMVSKQLCHIVQSSRSSSSSSSSYSIIWETRRPTKIGYERISQENDAELVTVAQLQHFCFTLRTISQETIQVKYSLINAVWDEHDNMRDGRRCRDLVSCFPFQTRPSIAIIRPRKQNQERHRLFVTRPPPCFIADDDDDDDYWMTFLGKDRNYIKNVDEDWTPDEIQDLRVAMDMVWKCSQLIAVHPDGTVYPSAEYLMQKLPQWLHLYFPDNCLAAIAAAAAGGAVADRETVVEFTYRPARTLAEWDAYVPHFIGDFIERDLHEIAWYRPGYSWVTCNCHHDDDFDDDDDSWMSIEEDDDDDDEPSVDMGGY